MSTNEWRKDYAILLQNWAMIRTSSLLDQMARDQLKQFGAEENYQSINHFKSYIKSIQSMSLFQQTTELWNKSIEQFVRQNNFFAAAECLEQLSDVQMKYGSETDKIESSNTLMRASKYYKRASNSKRAIIAIKRALILRELFSIEDPIWFAKRHNECGSLYESLDLIHLAKINRKVGDLFGEVTFHSENVGYGSINDEFDDKSLVWAQIKQLTGKSCPKVDTYDNSDSNEDNTEDSDEPISKYPSNGLLRQNLNNIFENNSTDTEVHNESTDESPPKPKEISVETIDKQNVITTQITVTPIATPLPTEPFPSVVDNNSEVQQNSKRKRKTKPKEKSEELPENRLKKLNQKHPDHCYVADPRNPIQRLLCELCTESVLCYRWSTLTDHLNSKRHTNNVLKRKSDYIENRPLYDFLGNYTPTPVNITRVPIPSTSGNTTYATYQDLSPMNPNFESTNPYISEPTFVNNCNESLRTPQIFLDDWSLNSNQ